MLHCKALGLDDACDGHLGQRHMGREQLVDVALDLTHRGVEHGQEVHVLAHLEHASRGAFEAVFWQNLALRGEGLFDVVGAVRGPLPDLMVLPVEARLRIRGPQLREHPCAAPAGDLEEREGQQQAPRCRTPGKHDAVGGLPGLAGHDQLGAVAGVFRVLGVTFFQDLVQLVEIPAVDRRQLVAGRRQGLHHASRAGEEVPKQPTSLRDKLLQMSAAALGREPQVALHELGHACTRCQKQVNEALEELVRVRPEDVVHQPVPHQAAKGQRARVGLQREGRFLLLRHRGHQLARPVQGIYEVHRVSVLRFLDIRTLHRHQGAEDAV
mmetsp:Transcript_50565/g.130286  ORF Transcript_50565/g.130286 Transcript_50565/m.130286 type:complete len:325 (-) Transcript_50565:97-1071(-)